MYISNIKARDLDEAWFLILREIINKGYEYTIDRGSYKGRNRKELDLAVIQITNPSNRPLVPVVPDGCPIPTSIEYVENEYLQYLMCVGKKENEQYTYGSEKCRNR